MDVKRIRKAVVAGLGTAVATVVSGALSDAPTTAEGWISLVFAGLGAGAVVAWTTFKVRNAGTVAGSDPVGRQVRAGRPPL